MATNVKGSTIASTYDRIVLIEDGATISSGASSVNLEIQTPAGAANGTPLNISTERIGIGAASPTALLTVGAITTLVTDGTTAVTPEGMNVHITEASKYAMGIKNADASGDGLLIQAGDASDDFALRVEDYDSANDLLVVRGDGNVGIGTSSPSALLHIQGEADGELVGLRLDNHTGGGGSTNEIISIHFRLSEGGSGNLEDAAKILVGKDVVQGSGTSADWNPSSEEDAYMAFQTVADSTLNERMRIRSDGRVGIGTAEPQYECDVKGGNNASVRVQSTTGSAQVVIQSNDETNNSTIIFASETIDNGSDGRIYYDHNATKAEQRMYFKTGDNETEAMVIDGLGKVGIGTASPQAELNISGTSVPKILIQDSDSNGKGEYWFLANDDKLFKIGMSGTTDGTYGSLTDWVAINNDGEVGIGTNAPETKLQISGSANDASRKLSVKGTDDSGADSGGVLELICDDGGALNDANHRLGAIDFIGSEAGGNAPGNRVIGAKIEAISEATWTTSSNTTALTFWTTDGNDNKAEKMRINNDGYVGIGIAAPTAKLHVNSSDAGVARGLIVYDNTGTVDADHSLVDLDYSGDPDIDDANFILFQDENGEMGSISGNGDATSFNETSDYRLKTDLKDIVDATGTIKKLKLYDFAWKKNESKRAMGVIAHEAQGLVPTAIKGKKDAMTTKQYVDKDGETKTKEVIKPQQVDYSKFVPLLLKSIQELSAKVEALENAN